MDSKKINWNKLLNSLIAGVAIILATIFFGFCFVIPKSNVKAESLTKEQINDYGIYFNSAKTRIRTASEYNKIRLQDNNNNYFFNYRYSYNDINSTPLYYSSYDSNILESFSSNYGNVYLNTDDSIVTIYEEYESVRNNEFIPYGVDYYKNQTNDNIEEIFYDEIDNGDFVLLNNYNIDNNNSFSVENFYLSFGTSYNDEKTHTTPIHELRVQGLLYSKDKVHTLALNPVNQTQISDSSYNALYWYQYFDLRNLEAYVTGEEGSNTYAIEDQQGKYVITFEFIRYEFDSDNNLVVSDKEETFTYTFYLLDSANYNIIPTIENAELGSLDSNAISEYFYNFTTDNPYISYRPQNFNISYTRENREITENINSSYVQKTYNLSGINYPLGIITYKNGNQFVKEVYILVYYNEDRNLVEYLYLANNSQIPLSSTPTTYNNFIQLLNNNSLEFEYKITSKLTTTLDDSDTKYSTTSYITYSYDKHEFCIGVDNQNNYENNIIANEYFRVTSKGEYYYSNDGKVENKTIIASITNKTTDNLLDQIKKTGVIIDKTSLVIEPSGIDETDVTINTTLYKLNIDDATQETKINKKYFDGTEIKSIDISIDQSTSGTFTANDPIDTYLSIIYTVDSNNTITDLKIVSYLFETSITNGNLNLLNRINSIDKIPVDITYNLAFDDLGIYTFNYNYNCLVYDGISQTQTITNDTNNSTNILSLSDFSVEFEEPSSTTPSENDDNLYLTIWGYLDATGHVTLADRQFVYNSNNNQLTDETNSVIFNLKDNMFSEETAPVEYNNFGDTSVPAKYTITRDINGQLLLRVQYKIALLTKTASTTEYNSQKSSKDYIVKTENKFTFDTILSISSGDVDFDNNSQEWSIIKSLVNHIESNSSYSINTYSSQQPNLNQDILHIFGSIAYFNKEDSTTDSGYAKLSQIDSKLEKNYISDVTKYNLEGSGKLTYADAITPEKFKGFTANALNEGLQVKNLIITDITPVFWKNLSTLLYRTDNTKISASYIYRYPNYSIDVDNNTINYGNSVVVDSYNKDIYCQLDGLYEVVVFYKYDNFKSLNAGEDYQSTIFYQLFTFIIDNSSPKLTIKVQDTDDIDLDGDTTEYITDLGLKKYTNKNIQLSWNIPTYFQNDVYIDIEKIAYGSDTQNFKAIYKQGNIITQSGDQTYINTVTTYTTPKENDDRYYVYITSNNTVSANGNYKVTLHYSSRGASTVTENFIIDKININGLKTLPVIQNANGTYSVNTDMDMSNSSSQIVNYNFTFRYNEKASGANIYTYWYKIDLIRSSTGEYDQQLNIDDAETAITTTYKVNGLNSNLSNISYGNQYIYNYNTDNSVNNANVFTSSSSCIYLFKMVDDAGNECRYVVFYDTTTPRFLITPATGNTNNIINDTTKIIWGDYKAILIDTESDYEINLGQTINDYNKIDQTIIKDNLQEALVYINSSSETNKFNNTELRLIDGKYYLILPIEEVVIKDESSLQISNSSTMQVFNGSNMPTEYYLFPNDPITTNEEGTQSYITLPNIVNDEIENKYLEPIANYSYGQVYNSDMVLFNRFITTEGPNIVGAFGQGEFTYQIYDKQRNVVNGYVWMNLDKTQTMAYGIFEKNSEDLSKAIQFTGEEGTYSVSKLYISSLQSSTNVPDYELTYQFYEFNDELYENLNNDYTIHSVKILTSADSTTELPIVGEQTYLQITYKLNTDDSSTRTFNLELTNEIGKSAPKHSYPYDLEGLAIVSDTSGNPQHIYLNNLSSYSITESDSKTRIFSTIINPTADTSGSNNIVTQEGLYVFKRTYTESLTEEELGDDELIIYRIYYVDRTGIINVTTLNSIAEKLTSNQDFGFVLGSDYKDEKQKTYINSDTIENSQSSYNLNSNFGNSHNTSYDLFSTNKIQVQFNITADKYNFNAFYNAFYNELLDNINSSSLDDNNKEEICKQLSTFLFHKEYYSLNKYKIDLTLTKGQVPIIDESSLDPNKVYNTTAIQNYLRGSYATNGVRDNSFNLFLEDSNSNPYYIYLKDNSGYRLWEDGNIINDNYLANELDISFKINHNAPTGDTYGKYYGRHDYDEDKSSAHSIPLEEVTVDGKTETVYALLSKYLKGQLQPLSQDVKYTSFDTQGIDGQHVTLYSTNNESLIFTFAITQDDYLAQIDPNNIQVYKGAINDASLIFNRVNGYNIGSNLVSESRMSSSFFSNVVDGITYYAIVIFDNNLDQILDEDEQEYSNYRLLDAIDNPDKETYYIRLNYVGDKENYIKEDNFGNKISFFSTTYEISIDRNKPVYNLVKLMELDKYIYENVTTDVTSSNYESVFEQYKQYYNFELDENFDFERSDLENYFFALDHRESTSFVFESISELDSNNGIYIRHINSKDYKFSITPDDYKSYYEATYLPGHPQFSPSRAITITSVSNIDINQDTSTYYYIPYGTFESNINNKQIKVSDLMKFLKVDSYYEIIESDEAGNYRVYAVYLPDYEYTTLQYQYKVNSNSLEPDKGTMAYNTNTVISLSGIEFALTSYQSKDYFAKANITIDSINLKETISVYYNPFDLCVYVKNSNNQILDIIENVDLNNFGIKFIEAINNQINNYNDILTTKDSMYYSQYGYLVKLVIVDRIGVQTNIENDRLYDYEITYNVAGSILSPIFKNGINTFTMTIPAQTGTTYIKEVRAYIFKNGWPPKDSDVNSNSFFRPESEFKKGFVFTLSKGIYKFEITDNFERTTTYFYEFGSSSTQAGGTLRFTDVYKPYTDGYTYTAKQTEFMYDNSLYDIFVKYVGDLSDDQISNNDNDPLTPLIYSSGKSYSTTDLMQYGLSVTTIDSITTIRFNGVNDITKYYIKTIPANISAQYNYTWGMEETNNKVMVYNFKFAIYTGIQNVIIKNLNGNILDSTEHLNLTEDFEVTTAWPTNIDYSNQIDFDSKIELIRYYTNENNEIKTEVISNSNSYIITQPGDYEARVINSLNNTSSVISFTRGEGEISMYAVYSVNSSQSNKVENKLTPSTKVDSEIYTTEQENRSLIVFNYYITEDYFSFVDNNGNKLNITDINEENQIDVTNINIDKTSVKYLDVKVNSNLSIFVQLYKFGKTGDTPYVQFRIYSRNSNNEVYTYRFIKIHFLSASNYSLVSTNVASLADEDVNIYNNNAIIKRPDNTIVVKFKFIDYSNPNINYVDGNTIYVDRYYNNELIETLSYSNITEQTESKFILTEVGLHKFVVRDLAGRIQTFGTQDNTAINSLQIYLINQIMFTVNDQTPINNQIFNDAVNIKIQSELAGLTLYNTRTLGITVTHNGSEISVANTSEFSFSESGYYTVKMIATTVLSDESSNIADQEITTIYNFVIVKTNIALRSFSVSKGTGFTIDKIIKIVNGEREEITDKYESKDSLIWLSHETEGNSIFEITLKSYNSTILDYQSFTFSVWINNDTPVIISNIPAGTSSKEVITLNFNPGIIYTQVGNCQILINDKVYMTIDENSNRVVETITINQKGTYEIKIVSEDGTLISSYKYTKNDPISNTTKIILISVACGIVVLVVLFLLIRRKGKYR